MKQKQFGQKCARWAIHQAVESVSAESAGQFLAIPDSRSEGEGGGFCRTQTCKAPTMLLHCVRTTIQLLGSHDVSVFRYLVVPVPARIFTTLLSFLCFIGQQRSLALFDPSCVAIM